MAESITNAPPWEPVSDDAPYVTSNPSGSIALIVPDTVLFVVESSVTVPPVAVIVGASSAFVTVISRVSAKVLPRGSVVTTLIEYKDLVS